MRAHLLVVAAAAALTAAGPPGCAKSDSPDSVCEHLIALREAAAAKPDEKPRSARVGKCLDNMVSARKKMGEAEWTTFAPCAVLAADVEAFVGCSPTMVKAAAATRQRLDEAEQRKEDAIKAGVAKMHADKAAKNGAPK